jgi:hypothetical protein
MRNPVRRANRLNETFAVGWVIKVFFVGSIYDNAAFEQDCRHRRCFQNDQIVEGVDAFFLIDDGDDRTSIQGKWTD